MSETLNCVDMSRWGGPLTAQEAEALWNEGVRRVIVGTGNPAGAGLYARQQASTWLEVTGDRGGELEAYIYLYMAGDPEIQVANALGSLAGLPVRRWWLDAEDVEEESKALSVAQRHRFLDRCLAFLSDKHPLIPGIYTGRWWWIPYMGNSDAYSAYPLWNSYYDGDPDTDGLPYGGWTDSLVEQFQGTTLLGGQSVDLNYAKDVGVTEMPDPRVDAIARMLTGCDDESAQMGELNKWNYFTGVPGVERRPVEPGEPLGLFRGNSLILGYQSLAGRLSMAEQLINGLSNLAAQTPAGMRKQIGLAFVNIGEQLLAEEGNVQAQEVAQPAD